MKSDIVLLYISPHYQHKLGQKEMAMESNFSASSWALLCFHVHLCAWTCVGSGKKRLVTGLGWQVSEFLPVSSPLPHMRGYNLHTPLHLPFYCVIGCQIHCQACAARPLLTEPSLQHSRPLNKHHVLAVSIHPASLLYSSKWTFIFPCNTRTQMFFFISVHNLLIIGYSP